MGATAKAYAGRCDEEVGLTSGVVRGNDSRAICALGSLLGFLLCGVAVSLGMMMQSCMGMGHGSPVSALGSRRAAVNFLVVGDWGREGKYNQSKVAHHMGRVSEHLDANFIVSTGDNFYERGLTGVDDKKFDRSFTDVYHQRGVQKQWYSILGNHDYMGDVLAQMDPELTRRDPRWFCGRTYQVERPLCSDSVSSGKCEDTIELFFFDTNTFITRYRNSPDGQSFDWRNMLTPWELQLETQLQNLTDALKASRATWKIVFGHHGIRSNGHHGDTPELVERLVPILEAYNVPLYVNGHDHDLEHVKRDDSSIHYITSGAGSRAYRPFKPVTPEDGQVFKHDGQGFISVSAARSWLHVEFYDVFGTSIHSLDLWK